MARSLSIGSPLLNTIRQGVSRSSSAALPRTLTDSVTALLSELAPHLLAGRMTQVYESDVMVRVFSSPETSADSVVKTTCSTTDGQGRLLRVIEFSRASASRLSLLLHGYPVRAVGKAGLAREFTVWTSPRTFARGLMRKRGRSFGGSRDDRYRE